MPLSANEYTYTGGPQEFPINYDLGYIDRDDIYVRVNLATDGSGDPVFSNFEFIDDANIRVLDPLVNGDAVQIRRIVSKTELQVDFVAGADVTAANINNQTLQSLMIYQELLDGYVGTESPWEAADAADASANLAKAWASNDFGIVVEDAEYSAKHYAELRAPFNDIPSMIVSDRIVTGGSVLVQSGYNDEPETFTIVAAGTYTANGQEVIDLTGVSGQAVSTRTWFGTIAEMLADTRSHSVGVRLLAQSFDYQVFASGSLTTAGSVQVSPINDDVHNIQAYNADPTGVLDSTAAVSSCIAFLSANRTQPPKLGNRGLGDVIAPKGKYRIDNTITASSLLSLRLLGGGEETTCFFTTRDDIPMFDFETYVFLEVHDMCFIHDTTADPSTWTNTVFRLSGDGGGRGFTTSHIRTEGFNKVQEMVGDQQVNEDTNRWERCLFSNCNTFFYARNSQAVINKMEHCDVYGSVDKVFDISGVGYTHFDTCNIIVDGTFLHIEGGVLTGKGSTYLATNCKFEYGTAGTLKFVDLVDDSANEAYITFINCGVYAGTPDANTYPFDLQGSKYKINVQGGQWNGVKIRTKARTGRGGLNEWGVAFKDCSVAPETTIERIAATGGMHVPITFEGCNKTPNATLLGAGGAGNLRVGPPKETFNSSTGEDGYLLYSSPTTLEFPTLGQLSLIDSVKVVVTKKSGTTVGAAINVYADAAKTDVIESGIALPNAPSTTTQVFDVSIPAGKTTDEGVYVEFVRTSGAAIMEGQVFVRTLAV